MAELNWSDDQWQKVNEEVTKTFNEASVAMAFIRRYGPLSGGTEIVRNERLRRSGGMPLTVSLDPDHDAVNLRLVNLTVNAELTSEHVSDQTLAIPISVFQDAVKILALEEERVILSGYGRGFARENSRVVVNRVNPQRGLADLPARQQFDPLVLPDPNNRTLGQLIVSAVVDAMNTLEANRHPGPFACVLGNTLFAAVNEPTAAMVLPADRVSPLLKGGPLHRSGQMEPGAGVVVSLSGNPIDIVVGTPPAVQFLQRQPNARFLFRVYERFVLRIRDDVTPPIAGFRIRPDANTIAREAARLIALRS